VNGVWIRDVQKTFSQLLNNWCAFQACKNRIKLCVDFTKICPMLTQFMVRVVMMDYHEGISQFIQVSRKAHTNEKTVFLSVLDIWKFLVFHSFFFRIQILFRFFVNCDSQIRSVQNLLKYCIEAKHIPSLIEKDVSNVLNSQT
jgi:hypothetical protein